MEEGVYELNLLPEPFMFGQLLCKRFFTHRLFL